MSETTDANPKAVTPPYIAFQSLKTLTKDMQEHGIPNQIDRTVLTNFSGSVGGQIITALKFLNLTDNDSRPNDAMKELVKAYGTDAWPISLSAIIERAYEPLFDINLETASPKEFNDRFRNVYGGTEEVQRKSKTFFLNAAREADIKISAYIMKNKKPRAKPVKRRAKLDKAGTKEPSGSGPGSNTPQTQKSVAQIVFEAFDPVNMPKEIQEATLKLLTYLKFQDKSST